MTRFYLVRHAHNDWIDKGIPGWTPGVLLNGQGRIEAQRLAERFPLNSITALFSSPLERARETAEPLAQKTGLAVSIRDDLGEVRCGNWTGLMFSDITHDELGEMFDTFRSGDRIPGGECIGDVQERMVRCLDDISRQCPDQSVVVVSHGDPIKTAIAHYAGIPLDFCHRIEIRPASVSILEIDSKQVRIVSLNDCGAFEF